MKVLAIAFNTFREAIRDKVLYSILFFALLLIGGSLFLGRLSIGDYTKIIKDMGLASISIFGTIIAMVLGIGMVYKELERRTIYTILSKPIQRGEFILGKFLGLALTLGVEVVIMSIALALLLWYSSGAVPVEMGMAVGFIYVELLVITAIAILFSAFSTPLLSGLFTLSLFVIGHLLGDIRVYGADSESGAVRGLTRALYYVLPNLENFNFKAQVVHDIAVPPEQLLWSLLYGVLYTTAVLSLAAIIFQRRDFK